MKLILIARVECRQGTNGFQMVSPLLHVGLLRQGGRGRWHQGRTEAAHKDKWTGEGWLIYREKLNIWRQKINYSYVIHPTSKSSMWIVKRSRFNEIFASAVSDQQSEQRFKKSNFWSTPEPLSNIFFCVTFVKVYIWCYCKYNYTAKTYSTSEGIKDWQSLIWWQTCLCLHNISLIFWLTMWQMNYFST
jgi:hypothetical protein